MSDGGKGSKPRPIVIDRKTFEKNWDRIFNKPKSKECSWKEDGVDKHTGKYYYVCSECGHTDWIATYGEIDELSCPEKIFDKATKDIYN